MSDQHRIEMHDFHGTGAVECRAYDVVPVVRPGVEAARYPSDWDYWAAVTNVPCPVEGCDQTVVWDEAGHVPGYRSCVRLNPDGTYDPDTIRHRFLARGTSRRPVLIVDEERSDGPA